MSRGDGGKRGGPDGCGFGAERGRIFGDGGSGIGGLDEFEAERANVGAEIERLKHQAQIFRWGGGVMRFGNARSGRGKPRPYENIL